MWMNPRTELLLSVVSLYNYDNTILDGITVPEGMDSGTLVFEILRACAGLSVAYPDTDFLKAAIQNWNAVNLPIWTKLYDTTTLTYNPIWNKDGTIETTTVYGEKTSDNTTGQRDGYSEDKVAGFDSATYTDSDKTINHSDEATDSATEYEHTDTITRTETGNIGITTTQQMIKEEREVSTFNIYKYIADDFKKEFCVLIY